MKLQKVPLLELHIIILFYKKILTLNKYNGTYLKNINDSNELILKAK